jgi:hypothetical protein
MGSDGMLWRSIASLDAAISRLSGAPRAVAADEEAADEGVEAIVVWVPGWAYERFRERAEPDDLTTLVEVLEAGPGMQDAGRAHRDPDCVGVDLRRGSVSLGFVAACADAERYIRSKWMRQTPRLHVERLPGRERGDPRRPSDESRPELVDDLLELVRQNRARYERGDRAGG